MAAAAAQRRASGRPQGEGRQAGSPPVSAGGGLAGAQRVGGRRRGALQAVHVGVAEAQPVPRLVHGVIVAGKALGDDRALQWAGVSGVFRGWRLLLWGWPMGGDAPHRLLAASACAVPAPGSCRFYPCSPAAAPGTEGGQAVVRQRGQYQVHPGCLARIGQRLRGEEGSQAAQGTQQARGATSAGNSAAASAADHCHGPCLLHGRAAAAPAAHLLGRCLVVGEVVGS